MKKTITTGMVATLLLTATAHSQTFASGRDRNASVSFSSVIGLSGDKDKAPNVYGGMWTVAGVLEDHHELSFSLGVLAGSDSESYSYNGTYAGFDTDVVSVPLILGYNYIIKANERLELYVGVRSGFIINSVEMSGSGRYQGYRASYKKTEDSFDPMFGVGAGFKYAVSQRWKLFAGYEYWRISMDNPLDKVNGDPARCLKPSYHVIKLGACFEF